MYIENLGKMKTDLLNRIKHVESELMDVTQQVGVNNRLEIYDEELIDRYVTLKQQMKYLTHNFLH